MANQKSILFLGSGATTGSGITKNCKKLPTDGEFFSESATEGLNKILPDWEDKYPALGLVRKLCTVFEESLFKTWNNLYIYRGLARAGIIREEQSTLDEFMNLANHPWPDSETGRREHYHWQFQIMHSNLPQEYYLAELAIWDLRVLVKEVYSVLEPQNEVYIKFWAGLKKRYDEICAVVNLNYDTTFDNAVKDSQFYYPGKESLCYKLPLIRPHGSLDWTSSCKVSIPDKNWTGGWSDNYKNTDMEMMGYRNIKNNSTLLDFRQPLIVAPAMFKEEVVGTSTIPGLLGEILSLHWKNLAMALRGCDHWIFIGVSFASGDDHLLALLKRYYKDNKNEKKTKVCCSIYNCDKTPLKKLNETGIEEKYICKHHINKRETIDTFNNYEDCEHRKR